MTQNTISTRKYAELLWQYTKRGIVSRYTGSYLGFLWPVLNPLLMLGLYVFVFGFVFKGKFGVIHNETNLDFSLALFIGLNTIQFINEIIGSAPRAIIGASNLVKKVVFPLSILPISTVGTSLFNHLISMVLALIGIIIFGSHVSLMKMLLWPVVLLPVVIIGLGMSFLLSAFGVFLRDISQLTGFFSIIILYCSAVFYPVSRVEIDAPHVWGILKWNPMLQAIDLSRHVLVWDMQLALIPLLYLYGISIALLFIGIFFFQKFRPAFADVL